MPPCHPERSRSLGDGVVEGSRGCVLWPGSPNGALFAVWGGMQMQGVLLNAFPLTRKRLKESRKNTSYLHLRRKHSRDPSTPPRSLRPPHHAKTRVLGTPAALTRSSLRMTTLDRQLMSRLRLAAKHLTILHDGDAANSTNPSRGRPLFSHHYGSTY